MTTDEPTLEGWVPVLARAEGRTLVTELCRIGTRRFAEPFFEDTVAACLRLPFHHTFRQQRDMDSLMHWVAQNPGLPPAGFIFHMSRCGSTLLSQWLAANPAHRVMSEPSPLDAALRAGGAIDAATRKRWLQTMVGLLGATSRVEERKLFIKFDSWHAQLLPLIVQAFPGVPWIFLIRDPVEVLVSHMRRPGVQMVPGLLGTYPPGMDPADAPSTPREAYAAQVLGGICGAVADALDSGLRGGMVVDYSELLPALDHAVPVHLSLQFDDEARREMSDVLKRDAKSPAFEFFPDALAKRQEATEALRTAVARWVEPAYRRLRGWAPARPS